MKKGKHLFILIFLKSFISDFNEKKYFNHFTKCSCSNHSACFTQKGDLVIFPLLRYVSLLFFLTHPCFLFNTPLKRRSLRALPARKIRPRAVRWAIHEDDQGIEWTADVDSPIPYWLIHSYWLPQSLLTRLVHSYWLPHSLLTRLVHSLLTHLFPINSFIARWLIHFPLTHRFHIDSPIPCWLVHSQLTHPFPSFFYVMHCLWFFVQTCF